MSLNILLMDVEMLKARTTIHGNLDPRLVEPDIKVAQDMYIHPILGSALYNKLLNDINSGTITGNYKELLDDYIVDCLLNYVLSELPTSISYQFWNKGVVRKQGENTDLPSMSDLIDIAARYKTRAEFYANRLMKYLQEVSQDKFPEYLNPGSGLDVMHPANSSFSFPVFLGERDCDHRTFEEKYQGNNTRC